MSKKLSMEEMEDRFWERVKKTSGCWEWQSAKTQCGYGMVGVGNNKTDSAHRTSWRMANGPIPEGLNILHMCDNPPCVRPSHLRLGTQKENMADMVAKGRANNRFKLTYPQVVEIRQRFAKGDVLQVRLAEEFGVCQTTISFIVRYKSRLAA